MARISQETIEQIQSVPILELAEALGDQPSRMGKQYRVGCPNAQHQENTPDTFIEPNRNIFKCFGGGGCGAGGNSSISYYSWHEYGGYEPKEHFIKSIKGIAELLRIPIKMDDGNVMKSGNTNYTPRKTAPRPVELKPQSPEIVDRVYRAFLSLCPIREYHAKEWIEQRKYTPEEAKELMFRSVPSRDEWIKIYEVLHSKGYPLERIPGFSQQFIPDTMEHPFPNHIVERDETLKGIWAYVPSGVGGNSYFIPVRDEFGRISRLRIRKNVGSPKYIWFSSMHNVDIEKEALRLRRNGVSSGAPANVVVPSSRLKSWSTGEHLPDIFKIHTVLATEGEHKSAIAANKLRIPVIGAAGVGNFKDILPMIHSWDVKKFIIAYDMDTLQREDDSDKSAKKQKNLFETLKEFALEVMKLGIDCYLWTWNLKDGKGLDDLLLLGRLPIEIDLRTGQRTAVNLEELQRI